MFLVHSRKRAIFARISCRDDRFANPTGQLRSQNAREATKAAAEISLSYRNEHSLKFYSFVGIRADCRCSLSSVVFSLNESNVVCARARVRRVYAKRKKRNDVESRTKSIGHRF